MRFELPLRMADALIAAAERAGAEPEWHKRARWLKADGYSIRAIALRLGRSRYAVAKALA